jgi:hypothetical protein
MWDLIDDVNDTYKPFRLTSNDTINLNDDSNATKKMQNFNIEGNTNVNDGKNTLNSPKKRQMKVHLKIPNLAFFQKKI